MKLHPCHASEMVQAQALKVVRLTSQYIAGISRDAGSEFTLLHCTTTDHNYSTSAFSNVSVGPVDIMP
jgi:hypothetical protein